MTIRRKNYKRIKVTLRRRAQGIFRLAKNKKEIVVAVSGGFDPIHIGHVEMFREAKALGDRLVVILNNDHWLRAKKRHIFMRDKERQAIIAALKPVDAVMLTQHPKNPKDMSVVRELRLLHPDIFANGGDRNKKDANNKTSSLNPEQKLCQELGIKLVFNVGKSGKIQSSSWLLAKYLKRVRGSRK